jgi:hypothetical protein
LGPILKLISPSPPSPQLSSTINLSISCHVVYLDTYLPALSQLSLSEPYIFAILPPFSHLPFTFSTTVLHTIHTPSSYILSFSDRASLSPLTPIFFASYQIRREHTAYHGIHLDIFQSVTSVNFFLLFLYFFSTRHGLYWCRAHTNVTILHRELPHLHPRVTWS